VPLATSVFDAVLRERPHQKDRLRGDVAVSAADLVDLHVAGGRVTEAGVRQNVSVALAYLDSWLSGNGAAAINNLMEDAATAEISRSQLWQWRVTGVPLGDGSPLTADRYRVIRAEELDGLGGPDEGRLREAADLLDGLVLDDAFVEFLTLRAYPLLG
jgi:malate synthase